MIQHPATAAGPLLSSASTRAVNDDYCAVTTGTPLPVDAGTLNRHLVLQNDVVFGSVNANRADYDAAARALSAADPAWLAGPITRRVPLEAWVDGLRQQPADVKVVVDLG